MVELDAERPGGTGLEPERAESGEWTPAVPTDRDLESWREWVARRLLGVMTTIAFVMLLAYASTLTLPALLIGVGIVLSVTALTVLPGVPHGARAATITAILAYAAYGALASHDPGVASVHLCAGLVFSTLLIGPRAGATFLIIGVGILGAGVWSALTGAPLPYPAPAYDPRAIAVSDALTYAGIGVAVLLSLSYLIERLRRALRTEAEKSEALERANLQLIERQREAMQLERALATKARLESVGQLAGSVAHDFNNLLMGMRGNIELSAEQVEAEEARELLSVSLELVDRAGELTRSLLRFSRGEFAAAEQELDVHELIRGSQRIYACVAGNGVELVFELDARDSVVAFNSVEFEQILLNLIVNAADAMPEGGRLVVSTRNRRRDELELLELSVKDEGEGMSETLMGMIFQPYFTTKEKGSGIGLATVQEIIKRAGGSISVESKLGRGTSFHLSFPLDAQAR